MLNESQQKPNPRRQHSTHKKKYSNVAPSQNVCAVLKGLRLPRPRSPFAVDPMPEPHTCTGERERRRRGEAV